MKLNAVNKQGQSRLLGLGAGQKSDQQASHFQFTSLKFWEEKKGKKNSYLHLGSALTLTTSIF